VIANILIMKQAALTTWAREWRKFCRSSFRKDAEQTRVYLAEEAKGAENDMDEENMEANVNEAVGGRRVNV